jgi:uncharacterized protein
MRRGTLPPMANATVDENELQDPRDEAQATERRSGPMRRVLVLALGWALVLLGIAGLFLPLLQGVALILVGLYVLSRESIIARRLLDNVRDRHPALWAKMRRLRDRINRLTRILKRGQPGPTGKADPTARQSRPE